MKRFTSHYIFCSYENILKRTVIEQNEQNKITNIIHLDQHLFEPEHTVFVDGIISSEIVSLKENVSDKKLNSIKKEYQYIDVSSELNFRNLIQQSNKQLVLDFGRNNTEIINSKLNNITHNLKDLSIIEIIASCTSLPSYIADKNTVIKMNNTTSLINWTNIDFQTMKATPKTKIRDLE